MPSYLQPASFSSSVNNRSDTTLFVEGENNSIDTEIVSTILRELNITVKPLKSSTSLKSCATAFSELEPEYYFLIDRDHHHDDEYVNKSWLNFCDNKNNLLIWKKKELENYFLDPSFLIKSRFCKAHITEEDLRKFIITEANTRIFQLAANRTIIYIREKLRRNWISIFDNLTGFSSKEDAIQRLLERQEFAAHSEYSVSTLNHEFIKATFHEILNTLTNNIYPLEWEKGKWLDFISGKPILNKLLNTGTIFSDRTGDMTSPLESDNRIFFILKDLIIKTPAEYIPADFKTLRTLIEQKLSRTIIS